MGVSQVNGVQCTALSNANVTDFALSGCGGLAVGKTAVLQIELSGGALLYILGFSSAA